MNEAELGAALIVLIDEAAQRSPWLSGKLRCAVSFDELAAMMAAPGDERLTFARGSTPALWTSVGLVRLDPSPVRAEGPFIVTVGASA